MELLISARPIPGRMEVRGLQRTSKKHLAVTANDEKRQIRECDWMPERIVLHGDLGTSLFENSNPAPSREVRFARKRLDNGVGGSTLAGTYRCKVRVQMVGTCCDPTCHYLRYRYRRRSELPILRSGIPPVGEFRSQVVATEERAAYGIGFRGTRHPQRDAVEQLQAAI